MTAKSAMVLGGSRGIGLACAGALLAEGHRVTITARSTANFDSARETLGGSAPDGLDAVVLDSTDHDAVDRAIRGRSVDILVVNTGIGFSARLADTSLADWARVLDINVTAAFTAMRAAVPGMTGRGWGRIVTLGSIAAHEGLRFGTAYSSSKHALLGLTRAVAAEVAATGVTVNMVSPAFVRTDMTTENAQRIAAASGRSIADAERALAEVTPLGRLLEPDEVAEQVVRLTRPDSAETNGTAVILDGREGSVVS